MRWLKNLQARLGGTRLRGSLRGLVAHARDGSITTAINAARLRKEVDHALGRAREQALAAQALAILAIVVLYSRSRMSEKRRLQAS